jgi:hypothetical protein
MKPESLKEILSFDGIAAAEKITGASYKDETPDGEATMALGMLLHMDSSERKRKILKERNDTHFGITFLETVKLLNNMGFAKVYEEKFGSISYSGEPTVKETFMVLWSEKGVLVTIDSYNGRSLNSGEAYFNYESDDYHNLSGCSNGPIILDSSSPDRNKWTYSKARECSLDIREGFKYRIESMSENGKFLNPWQGVGFLWLLNYREPKIEGYNYKQITYNKLKQIPAKVITAMFGSENNFHKYFAKEIGS